MQGEDIFASTFAALRSSLKALQEGQDGDQLRHLDLQLQQRVVDGLQQHSSHRLQQLQHQQQLVRERYESLLDLQTKAGEEIRNGKQHFELVGQQHHSLASYRLQQQQSVSDRRLQDLIFEVMGEYGKALVRAKRREDYLLSSGRMEKILQTWTYLWRRFILRLQFDLSHQSVELLQRNTKLSLVYLSPSQDSVEILHLIRRINKKIGLVSGDKFLVTSVIRIAKGITRTIPPSTESSNGKHSSNQLAKATKFVSAFSNQNIRIADNKRDLAALLEELNVWVGVKHPTTSNNSTSPRPSSARTRGVTAQSHSANELSLGRLLSTSPCAWLQVSASSPKLWDQITDFTFRESFKQQNAFQNKFLHFARVFQMQHQSSLFNDRVYFCLEERSIAQSKAILKYSQPANNSISVFDMLTTLQEIYTDYPQTHSMLISPTLRGALNEKSDAEASTVLLLTMQRMFLTHPLRVISFQNKHQSVDKFKHVVSQRSNKALLEAVTQFPDILVVQSLVDDTIFHFAPASVLNLLELSEGIARSGMGIPTLFCPILSPSVPSSSILRNQTSTVATSLTATIMQSRDGASAFENVTIQGGSHVKNTSFEPIYVLPLSENAVELLSKSFLNLPGPTEADGFDRWSCLQILPDHCRKLGCSTASSATHTPRAIEQRLSHTFALLADENPFGLPQSIDASGNKIVQSSYYLVQLAPVHGDDPRLDLNATLDQTKESCNEYEEDFEQSADLAPSKAHSIEDNKVLHYCIAEELRRQTKVENVMVCAEGQAPTKSIPSQQTTFFTQEKDEGGKTPRTARRNAGEGDDEEKSEAGSTLSSSGGKKWDMTILSRICHWRSCLCDVADGDSLCRYHVEMKHFLDTRMSKGGTLESGKYLPKKPPSFSSQNMTEHKRDLMTIRAASTLLQELWDGRLKSTVKLFSKKMTSDMKLRSYMEGQLNVFLKYHGNSILKRKMRQQAGMKLPPVALNDIAGSLLPMPPTWSLWKNRDHLEKTIGGQNSSLELLNNIFSIEQAISQEITAFMRLQCFPGQELNTIRKEIKAFKDQQEELLANLQLNTNNPTETDNANGNKKAADGKDGKAKKSAANQSSSQNLRSLTEGYDNLIHILTEESRLCDKKFMILTSRREAEEEARLAFMKRLAKVKAAEDNQSKDPHNFKNQGGRF